MTRPTDSVFRRSSDESIHKRISYDENKLKATLKTPETEVKASSLPRGAKIGGLQEVDGWRGGVGSGKAVSRGKDMGVEYSGKFQVVVINWKPELLVQFSLSRSTLSRSHR